jgi:micrococcal nuclease
MNKRIKRVITFLAILVLIFIIYFNFIPLNQIKIVEVVDGDTVKLATGEYVRLLGINSPEKGQKFSEEAKNRLEELVKGKRITLKQDIENKDKYGRLLRYLYANDIFVNLQLVREGYAKPYFFGEIKYKPAIEEAWRKCKEEELNLCGIEEKCDNTCIGLQYINWNARGNDCQNLNDEYVVFKNYCNISCNLTNWLLFDKSNNSFTFPEFILKSNSKITIYSGDGKNTKTKLYWNSKVKGCGAIWNNGCEGDTVYLMDSNKKLILNYSYQGFC